MWRSLKLWFSALRLFVRHVPAAGQSAPEWLADDAASLRRWLATEHGKKFRRLLAVNQAEANRLAVLPRHEAQYSCGFAAGYSAMAALFDTLSADDQPESVMEHQPETLGGKALAELLAP